MFVKVFIVACFVSASVIATPVLKKVDQTSSKPPSVKNICGGIDVIELDSDTAHGFISSPGYPGTYPASIIDPEDCGSQVTVANNTIDSVLLGFLQLRLRPGDYLSIKQTFYNPPSERTEQ
ncbi:unnamed protein product [Notodromas monacha]|uniref:CUB domain-containing protein n=1 Tax=Notodromas monacha TaxID=399045 RepID=A0A7R9GB67_9CRUS|nr:unnamed protein product [Notodromas monacha]CAG0916185.1 unnamed protein product [Notodromas monacha]